MADLYPGATHIQVGGFFPRSGIEPQLVVSVIHITAGLGDALSIAKSVEAKQVTASFWTNRSGAIVQTMLDPSRQGPWTNGVMNNPDLSNRRIARMKADGVNPNKRSLLTIENVGIEPGNPITPAQERACANLIAHYHAKYGVPVNRETVVGHYQFDSVNRRNCPSTNKAIIDRIVAMASGGGQPDVTTTITKYTGQRDCSTKGGALTGYRLNPPPLTKSGTFAAGSGFHSDSEYEITPTPAGWPAGPYQRVVDGFYAGYLLANAQINLGAIPSGGFSQKDLDKAYNDGLGAAKDAVDAVPPKA